MQMDPRTNFNLVVSISQPNEREVQELLAEYQINPILLWEIIMRQCYDKVFKIDNNTILYNV